MSLSNTQKVDVRRHLGYPVAGGVANSFTSYRFFQNYGMLEWRLNNLATEEEVLIITYIGQLNQLETDIYGMGGASGTIGTKVAAVWERNPNELADRQQLFNNFKKRLSDFLGVPQYDGGSSSGIKVLA